MKPEESLPDVDTKSLILALTAGIGAPLGKPVLSSHFELVRRLARSEQFRKLDLNGRQQVVDVLALSMFYASVVAPLECGSSLLHLVHRAKAKEVRIGKDRLSGAFSIRSRACVEAFRRILHAQRIPVAVLSFANLDTLINNVVNARERAQRETMD